MKKTESTNDKILRLYNEGWEAEKIAEEVTIPVGSVHSILERRVEGYAELLAQKSLAANKARTAAREEALKAQRAAEEAREAKQAKYSSHKPAASTTVNPDDFFNSSIDGMLVGNYKQKMSETASENVSILTAEENRNLLTGDLEEAPAPVAEDAPVVEPSPVVKPTPVAEPSPVVKPTPVAEPAPVVKPAPVAEPAPVVKPAPVAEEIPVPKKTTAARTTAARKTKIESEEPVMDFNATPAADPAATAAQKIAVFAKSQIAENESKMAAISQQIAALNEQITALQAENEQYRALIK